MTTKISLKEKGVLHRLNISKDPKKLLGELSGWFQAHPTNNLTLPILNDYEAGTKTLEATISELKGIVFKFIMDGLDIVPKKEKSTAVDKPMSGFVATVYDKNGEVVSVIKETEKDNGEVVKKSVKLIQDFSMLKQAENWCHNRMWNQSDASYAIISNDKLCNKNTGLPISFRVERVDATRKVLGKKSGPVMKVINYGGSSLKFKGKASQTRVTFSHG